MKILVAEAIAEKGIEVLRQSGALADVKLRLPREELLAVIPEYDAIIVRSETKINEELYERARRLKVVGRAGNGVDNIEMEGATKRGIIVVNTPDANSISAAEHTIGLLIASCRNIPAADNYLKNLQAGPWDRSPFKGVELHGKTIGIVGLGRIGSLVATRLQSFGMRVIAYDPYITDERFKKLGVEKKETLQDLITEADFITVHTPKTEETTGMIGAEQLKMAKPGVRLVNCARGGIIDEEALAKALQEGVVGGAGIDVLLGEPHPDSPLLHCCHTVVTPHLGADTVEAQDNVGVTIAREVINALRGEMVPNAVNLPALQRQELEVVLPYLTLGEVLGKLYHQLEKDPVEKVEIIYKGEVSKVETSIVTLAVLKGLFEPVLKERVNYVNARLLAESRGIVVSETKAGEVGSYVSLIQVKVLAKDKAYTFAGSVFGKGGVRIVEVCGFEFEIAPSPYMLVVENIDRPGMIGQIGTLLGASNVNIATMQVSRNVREQQMMMLLTVDSEVSKEVLGLMRNIEGVYSARIVKLANSH